MAASPAWLSINELGRIYGISAIHCSRALQEKGWQNTSGEPTPDAVKAGAASIDDKQKPIRSTLWNAKICRNFFEKTGYQPISRRSQIDQWAQLLEALTIGSPSINATAEQMAEDLPKDLISDVNDELAQRGCHFRVKRVKTDLLVSAAV